VNASLNRALLQTLGGNPATRAVETKDLDPVA